jgi:hypothetical protein
MNIAPERKDIIRGTGSAKWPDDPEARAAAQAKAKAWADAHPEESGSRSPESGSVSPDSGSVAPDSGTGGEA